MRFDPKQIVAGLLTVAVFGNGCGWVGERRTDHSAKIGSKVSGCLEGFSLKLRKYFNGQAGSRELPEVLSCAERALDLFVYVAKPTEPGKYGVDELSHFLRVKFLGKSQVRDSLFEEGMLLKRSILGGDAHTLTVSEIRKTQQLLRILSRVFVEMHPFAPFDSGHAASMSAAQMVLLREKLHESAQMLGGFFDKNPHEYSFEDLHRLLFEFETLYDDGLPGGYGNGTKISSGPKQVRESLPLVRVLKDLFVAPGRDAIRNQQWTSVFTSGAKLLWARLGAQHLKQAYPAWFAAEGFSFLKTFMQALRSDMQWAFVQRNGADIPLTSLDEVMVELKRLDMVPEDIRTQSLIDTMRPLFNSLLSVRGKQGVFSLDHLILFWSYFERLAAGEEVLRGLFESLAGPGETYRTVRFDPTQFKGNYLNIPVNENWFEGVQRPYPTVSGMTMRKMFQSFKRISSGWPLFQRSENIVSFIGDHVHTYDGLSSVNVVRVIVELILEAYGKENEARGITLPEFTTAFEDIKPLGIDLRFIDPRNTVTAQVRFSEGNLFVFSNPNEGEKELDYMEMIELFSFMGSSIRLGREAHNEIVDSKRCAVGGPDVVGQTMVVEDCFRFQFFKKFASRFRTVFPKMSRYYEDLIAQLAAKNISDEERALRSKRLEKFEVDVIHPDRTPGMIESADTVAYVQVLNYVEALFTVFDENDDGVLSEDEASNAFPRFRSTLIAMLEAEKAGATVFPISINETSARNLLRFLLEFGRKPEGLEFVKYHNGWGQGVVRADRGTLVGLLAYLQFKNREIQEHKKAEGR